MLSVPFVLALVGIILLLRRNGFFAARRSQQTWYVAAFAAAGIFGTYLIQALDSGASVARSILGAASVAAIGTTIVVGLVKLRGKTPK
jgi:hypothetical protein